VAITVFEKAPRVLWMRVCCLLACKSSRIEACLHFPRASVRTQTTTLLRLSFLVVGRSLGLGPMPQRGERWFCLFALALLWVSDVPCSVPSIIHETTNRALTMLQRST
jgi:hypothetical protein